MKDPLTHFHYYANETKSKNTIFLFHGTGGNEKDLLALVEPFLATHSVVGLRGNDLERGMSRFFRRISEGIFDQESIKAETAKLHEFLQAWYAKHNTTPQDSIFIGYSNGANFILATMLYYPQDIVKAAVHHAMLPFEPTQSVDLSHHEILVTLGKNDPIIAPYQSEEAVAKLREYQAKVQVVETMAGHSFTHEELEALHTFIQKNS